MNENTIHLGNILDFVPQQRPFRFIDRVVELSEEHIIGEYTFAHDEYFYRGHFPGNPVTSGVILVESMAQTGVVALGIYLTSMLIGLDELRKWTTFFTDNQTEFRRQVLPGQKVIIQAKRLFWRRMKLKSQVSMYLPSGELVADGQLSGLGVKNEK